MVETVNIEEFLRTGKFGAFQEINFGIHRNQLEQTLGKTDWLHYTSNKSKFPSIYKYGLVEFYFEEEENGRLHGIQVQLQSEETPKQCLEINYGFLTAIRTLERIEQELIQRNITFQAFTESYDSDDTKRLKTEGNVILIFGMNDKNKFMLHKVNKFVQLRSNQVATRQINFSLEEKHYETLRERAMKKGTSIAKVCADIIKNELNK